MDTPNAVYSLMLLAQPILIFRGVAVCPKTTNCRYRTKLLFKTETQIPPQLNLEQWPSACKCNQASTRSYIDECMHIPATVPHRIACRSRIPRWLTPPVRRRPSFTNQQERYAVQPSPRRPSDLTRTRALKRPPQESTAL